MGHCSEDLVNVLKDMHIHMPPHLPVHLLGIGDHATIEKSIVYGIDTFDSWYVEVSHQTDHTSLPSRLGRHGILLTDDNPKGINITQTKYKNQVDRELPYSPGYSFAALHHLIKQHEPVGMMLGTLHNISWMMDKMARLRQQILNNEF